MACIRICTIICMIFLAACNVFSPVVKACRFDSDCSSSYSGKEYCCDRNFPENNICKTSCVGETCISDSDCADDESCCNDICRSDCVGESCVTDYDCGTGECCDSHDKCTKDDCDVLAGWIIAVIVISVLVSFVVPIAVVIFCCCCAASASTRRAHRGAVIVTQPTMTGTTVVGTQQQNRHYPVQQGQQMYLQNSQTYPTQPPPAYQTQAMAYPPPTVAYPATTIPPQTGDVRPQ